ncbi:hypothetical protein [Staphylococcus sp. IVB6227]|uniref:hypothetical protein n=1 Tax=Staphylococcus sp. IVB6227 TaxID=2989768 RepID=UPI0021D3842C|nr:hypothetical protein [Staphylococcus sp. IVB6227]UXR79025.1 hypothetical protein MUA92_03810 [Staphylococcus sp. IVB6227]
MDIKFLQSLDFLIQTADKNPETEKLSIVFELNKELFTANFIKGSSRENAIFNSIKSYEDEEETIPLMSAISYRKLSIGDNSEGVEAPLKKIARYLETKDSFDTYRLLKFYIKKFDIGSPQLGNFAFNVKNLKTGEYFPFVEFGESSRVQFVTLATDEDLQTLTHASK